MTSPREVVLTEGPEPGASEASAPSRRNSFLDAVRIVALIRVVVWHTYGYAWISYFVASMPAMFFVAGSLMASSLRRSPASDVLFRRFKRLLVPLWVMGSLAIAVMVAAGLADPDTASGLGVAHLIWWLFPLSDPTGSEWGVTLWAPLWYMRCLTWLLLSSPLLLFFWRRIGHWMLTLPLVALAGFEASARQGNPFPWQIEDFALFSFFWLLGFSYSEGSLSRLKTCARITAAVLAAMAAAVWALTQDVPAGVVNASYPLHLFVGLAWLFGALALEEQIGRIALHRRLDAPMQWIGQRAMTIYIWQSFGLLAMYQILWTNDYSRLTRDVLALPIVASVTFLAVILFGWVEDLAAGRSLRIWPLRRDMPLPRRMRAHRRLTLVAGAFAAIGATAIVVAASGVIRDPSGIVQATAQTVPPSGVGLHIRAEKAAIHSAEPARPVSSKTEPVTNSELYLELEAWLAQWHITGATVTLRKTNGEVWTGAAGIYDSGAPFLANETYWIASVTKTFTAALIMQLVDEGRLALEDPVSRFVPDFPDAERITIRHLLQHTSGLIFGDDTPFTALNDAAKAGLQSEPGVQYAYSRSGYYLLGLIIENLTEQSYTTALHERILDPIGLISTLMDEELYPLPYSTHPYHFDDSGNEGDLWTVNGLFLEHFPGTLDYHGQLWSSGGLWSTTGDITNWALAFWASDRVISAAALKVVTTFSGAEFDFTGLATHPFCPCWMEDGALRSERWGFAGATGVVEYDPADEIALAIHMNGTLYDENVVDALEDLSVRLRRLVRKREMATEDVPFTPVERGVPVYGGSYLVREGDTLSGIAVSLGISQEKMEEWITSTLELNGLDETSVLEIGQELLLPN